jgi:hypothetical protein
MLQLFMFIQEDLILIVSLQCNYLLCVGIQEVYLTLKTFYAFKNLFISLIK